MSRSKATETCLRRAKSSALTSSCDSTSVLSILFSSSSRTSESLNDCEMATRSPLKGTVSNQELTPSCSSQPSSRECCLDGMSQSETRARYGQKQNNASRPRNSTSPNTAKSKMAIYPSTHSRKSPSSWTTARGSKAIPASRAPSRVASSTRSPYRRNCDKTTSRSQTGMRMKKKILDVPRPEKSDTTLAGQTA